MTIKEQLIQEIEQWIQIPDFFSKLGVSFSRSQKSWGSWLSAYGIGCREINWAIIGDRLQ